jgi:hypothetical protein
MGSSVEELDLGPDLRDVVVVGDVHGDLIVALPVVILGPRVELPVCGGEIAVGVFDEDGAGVAEPDAVSGPLVEVEAGEVGSGATEEIGGAAFGFVVVDEDVDVFDAREMTNDLAVDPRDGLEFAGPVVGVMRPGDPGGGVRSPLGGHAVLRLRVGCAAHLVVLLLRRYPLPGQKVCKVFDPCCLDLDLMCPMLRTSLMC